MGGPRAQIPARHGEVILRPAFDEWPAMARENARVCESWEFEVGGLDARELRSETRRVLTAEAAVFTARLGLRVPDTPAEPETVVVTGHQPEFYHTGVWAKDFLLQRMRDEYGATGVDLVVDSDTFDSVHVTVPCLIEGARRCRQYLSVGWADTCFACAPVPSEGDIETFCGATSHALTSLNPPSLSRHFDRFCHGLREAALRSANLAELVTGARRRFEGELTDYLELPVTIAARAEPVLRFAADILVDAVRFADTYNRELADYRRLHGVRSAAHPFPDLDVRGDSVEVPFWLVSDDGRSPARVRSVPEGIELISSDAPVAVLPSEPQRAFFALLDTPVILAPRGLILTLFTRAFFADLFIHGVGGERYDRVTDAVAKSWWGIDLPLFAVASLTMHLPLGVQAVTAEDIAAIEHRLRRLEHNPDEVLQEVGFDSLREQEAAEFLVEEKRGLVEAIQLPDADKKALGQRIRVVNAELGRMVEPLANELENRKRQLESQLAESEILTDRTYPFCLWDPADIADRVR